MKNVKLIILAVTLIVLVSINFACNQTQPKPLPLTPSSSIPDELEMPITAVKVWDAKLRLGFPDPASQDKRPPYLVEGRITNLDDHKIIGKVLITVQLENKSTKEEIDMDEFTVSGDIRPGQTQAFSRVAHLLPPDKDADFSWGLEATEIVEHR
jgi:hypothetical protein